MAEHQHNCAPVPQQEESVLIDFEPIPKERKKRARQASITICSVTALLVLIVCYRDRYEVKYHPDDTASVYCGKKEELTFSGLFTIAMGLFSIILGTLVDRLTLVFEERHHLKERYGESKKEMFKACYSGIQWGPVVILLACAVVIVMLITTFTHIPWYEPRYLVIIFSGIGVGPLVMQLLNLNTQSKVHISTILEEKGMCVANQLAWSYYFNYLEKALPVFQEAADRHQRSKRPRLSFNKLLLLMPYDCRIIKKDLADLDNTQIKFHRNLATLWRDNYKFRLYRLKGDDNDQPKFYAMQFVKEPLETLARMSEQKIKPFDDPDGKNVNEEVKRLHKILSEILEKFPECTKTCVLVPIQLDNKKPARGIINAVEALCGRTDDQEDSTTEEFDDEPPDHMDDQDIQYIMEYLQLPTRYRYGRPERRITAPSRVATRRLKE